MSYVARVSAGKQSYHDLANQLYDKILANVDLLDVDHKPLGKLGAVMEQQSAMKGTQPDKMSALGQTLRNYISQHITLEMCVAGGYHPRDIFKDIKLDQILPGAFDGMNGPTARMAQAAIDEIVVNDVQAFIANQQGASSQRG